MAAPTESTPGGSREVAPDPIFQLATGFMSAKHLFVANEVGLFEELSDGPATLDELAQRIGLPRRTTRIVADAMTSLGLVQRSQDRYQNGPLAALYLSRQPRFDLRPFLRFWNRISYQRWTTFEDAVRQGRGVLGMLQFTAEEQKIFSEGVEAFSAGSAEALPNVYDFSRHQRVVDLGGGTGSFLKALLRKYPSLVSTLYEIPAAAAVARNLLAGTPFAEKIHIVEGDFFRDPIPQGNDAFLLANVVHVLPPDRNLELLGRVRRHAVKGARLLVVDLWTNPMHTDPAIAALMAGEFLVMTGDGDVYSVEEVQNWFHQSGWQFVDHRPVTGPTSLVVAEAA